MGAPFSFMGIADVLMDILTDEGVSTGLELKGNCPTLTIKGDSERIEQEGTGLTNFAQVIASATFPKPMSMSSIFNQMDEALFAAAFFGTNSAFTQSSGTLTDVPIVTIADKWVEIGSHMLSSIVVKETSGGTTFAADNYEINPRLGLIKAKSTGTIPSGATVYVSGSKAAINGTQMVAMTHADVRARILVDGQNKADGRRFILDIYQARFAPSGEFGFQAGDKKFMEAKFDATLETPSGKTEPFKLIWLS